MANKSSTRRSAKRPAHTPRVMDLFCGAGGLSEGFRQTGFAIAAGSDIDPDACATYAANFPEAATVWGDLRESQAAALRRP